MDNVRKYRILQSDGTERDVEFRVVQNANGTWYAMGLGCSRDHAYWYHAIRELCDAECAKILHEVP